MYIAHWFITHPSYTAIQCFLPDDIKLPKPQFYMKIGIKHELLNTHGRIKILKKMIQYLLGFALHLMNKILGVRKLQQI